jgi:diguanylate cyclase (GGDEF)-like protein
VLDISIRSLLGLQLKHRGKPVGLLVAFYRRPDAPSAVRAELRKALAQNIGVALTYSSLLEQSRTLVRELEAANARLEMQAVQDGLTGLANHRAFHQRLAEHVHRVGRYHEVFTLAMLDVDHFKSYNDAYGHQEGDVALQQIAAIISGQLRESDIAARYGGEEFAIILPQTSKAGARVAVERIRTQIDTHEFPNGKLTVSAGIAECPLDGVTANVVLEKADRALYHAKLTGRNRVCLWATSQERRPAEDADTETRPLSVLVVEHDREARQTMESALARAGYDLHRACSSQEAIRLLRSRKFDIMLSDALILSTEGQQVLGLASAIHPTMPIVLTTAASMAGAARDAMRHGVTDLLVKPFSEHELPVVIERNIERKRIERQMLLEKSTGILLQAIDALVAAIDAKDRMTAGHSARVTDYSLAIADALGLPSEERYTLELAARLHDIGKLSLPDSALNKSGRLTDAEWAAMRRHPSVGSQIVGSIEELSYVATVVRHHHERLDGQGYPDGLEGEAIPFLSRIIAVADAFEAMTSDRAFRQKRSVEEAIAELRRCVGTHYSPEIVQALAASVNMGSAQSQPLDDAA